jgi:MinD-like ATPase involved in chromosome partitioning or flagellar assembly
MPKIISVHSCRHGTGKSNLTANLAVSISQQGYRVGIIDLDIQSPGIHTLFGLDHEHLDQELNYYLWGNISIDGVTQSNSPLLRYEPGRVAVMGGEIRLPPCSIKINDIAQLLQTGYDVDILSQSFFELIKRLKLDYLLIDTHPVLNEETLFSIAISDVLVLVSSLDSQDFQGLAVTIDIADRLDIPKILLVANQILSRLKAEDVKQQLEETYGETVAGVLPFVEEMLLLASSDIFCLRYPDHALTMGIKTIAQQLVGLEATLEPRERSITTDWLKSSILQPSHAVKKSGLSMADILMLPDEQRHLISWMMRQGSATLTEAVAYTNEAEVDIKSTLGTLIEKGFVQQIIVSNETRYQICLAPKRGSRFAQEL